MITNTNVDHVEVAKFEAIASRWWDPNGELKSLHDINPLRLAYIERLTNGLDGKMVLDVGCGGGVLTEGLASLGANILGIDMGVAPLEVAELHAIETGAKVQYRQITVEQLALETPAQYDVITCMEMLEHVPNPESVVKACSELVRPGGWVFFSTLNRTPKAYLFGVIGAEYILGLIPKGTHQFAKFIQPAELGAWTSKYELNPQDITGMSYDPFTQKYCLGKDISVNYFMACQKFSP